MKYWLTLAWIVLAVLCSWNVAAGDTDFRFSKNRDVFIKALETYMKKSNNQLAIKAYEDFATYFNAGHYSEQESAIIIDISNLMLEQKIKPNPVFRDYLSALLFIKSDENLNHVFSEWHDILRQMLTTDYHKEAKRFKNYVDFSTTLFSDGALKTGHRGNAWLADNAVYHLESSAGKHWVRFEQLDLKSVRQEASFKIASTSGNYFPEEKRWEGQGGKIYWPASETGVYCLLEGYNLKFSGNLIDIDSVVLYHREILPGVPVKGRFSTKLLTTKKQAPGYPKFISFDDNIIFSTLDEKLLLKAGLKINGNDLYGKGGETTLAELSVMDAKGHVTAQAKSAQFKIELGSHLSGKSCKTALYIGKDSLYHPAINWRYNFDAREIQLKKGTKTQSEAPFYVSHQKMYIHTDKITWKVGAEAILVNEKNKKIGNGSKTVKLESLNFYDTQLYRKLQSGADRNPISILKILTEKRDTLTIDANDYAKALNPRFDVSQIKSLLLTMAGEGLINYDARTETIDVFEKLIHTAAAAHGQTDYDLIRYYSKSDETNAKLYLDAKSLVVDKVNIVEFSQHQQVAAKPFQGQVTVAADRNTHFDGKLFAGFSTFTGKDFRFNYQKNEIQLDSVRYFDLFTTPYTSNQHGAKEAFSIASRIEHLSGTLLIDAPSNKSGKQDIPVFPSFNSKGSAYLFYDRDTLNTYPRDSFYFELDEFHLNALDELTPEKLAFKGRFESAGILPVLEEIAVLQEDGSLGFKVESPDDGYAAYGGKGGLKGDIRLDNNGLVAAGAVEYGSATIQSEAIVLKPNQLLTAAENFDLEESREPGKEVPEAHGQSVKIDWKPYQDSMFILAQESDFQLFKNGDYRLRDMLILTPDGLRGRGVFDWETGRLESQLYTFEANAIIADTTNLTIKAPGMDHLALDTKNVYAKLNFDHHIGTVRANSDSVFTELPYNTYITSLNEFDWDMKNETVTFRADEDGNGSFKSTNEAHDGLTFWGKEAFYDLKTYELRLGGVSKIETADAFILPDSGAVEIQRLGKMKILKNARIIADTANQYHIIKNADVEVLGRLDYRATGFYEYNIGDRQQEFKLTEIVGQPVGKGKRKNKKCLTTAIGKTISGNPFYIDQKTRFSGDIALSAAEAHLNFEGFAKLDAENYMDTEWFSIKSKGDKNDLKLSYAEPVNKQGQRLYTGILLHPLTGTWSVAIMNGKSSQKDHVLFEAAGLFDYVPDKDVFRFGDSLKIVSEVKNGNLVELDNRSRNVAIEGRFTFFDETAPIQATVAGQASIAYADEKPQLKIETLAGFNFYLPEKLMKIIEADLRANAYNLQPIDYTGNRDFYHQVLSEMIPPGKDLANTRAKMPSIGLEFPKKYNTHQLVLADLDLVWNEEAQALESAKEQFGLVTFNGNPINRKINGKIQFRALPSGSNRLRILLTIPGGNTRYYLEYQDGSLLTVSDNPNYNGAVDDLKKKERLPKTNSGAELEVVLGGQGRMRF